MRGIKFHGCVVKILGLLIVGLTLAAVGAWIYGLAMAPRHQDDHRSKCSTAAMWVIVLCATSLGQCVILSFLKYQLKESIAEAALQGKKHWSQHLQSIFSGFLFVWLCYGGNIFFSENTQNCPAELWKFGLVYSICFLSMIGILLVFMCSTFRLYCLRNKLGALFR